jgi:thiol-disulfide isomerase/thioredoxin
MSIFRFRFRAWLGRSLILAGCTMSSPGAEPGPWPVPPDVFALDDARMDSWSAQPDRRVRLTGRVSNLSSEQRAKAGISVSLVTLRASGQEALACELRPDGTFELDLPATVPRQQLWLRIRPLAYLEIILERGLHLEIDAARMGPATGQAHPGLEFSGPDAVLNSEVNRFVFAFEPQRRRAIDQELGETARAKVGSFPDRFATLTRLRRDYEGLLRDFAPQAAGWFLHNEIAGDCLAAVLQAATATRHRLVDEPVWREIQRHAAYGVTNDQLGFLHALQSYLLSVHTDRKFPPAELLPEIAHLVAGATPELQAAHRRAVELAAAQPAAGGSEAGELAAALAKLREAGLLPWQLLALKRVRAAARPLLPPAKIDLLSLALIPRDAAEARHVVAELQRGATQPWLREYLALNRRATDARAAAINATLAESAPPAGRAETALGAPLAVLPSGASLFHWPDLGGQALLARLRAALPGKALVLDFWGPWCSPCLAELPHSERMHAALRDEPVEFVYLGSRTTDAPWRRTIAELRLGGTHILLTPPQVDELMAFFGLGGFPGYAFIDRQGAHRPGVITRFSAMKPDDFRRLLR